MRRPPGPPRLLFTLLAALTAVAAPGAGVAGAQTQSQAGAITEVGSVRLVVAPEGNAARYLVREQLAGFDFPNDAIGETSRIEGAITLDAHGRPVPGGSRIVVEVASLTSDAGRRDNYLRRRTLDTENHPVAVLVPTEVRGLPHGLPASGDATFQLVGDVTIRGVTKPLVWDVTARRDGAAIVGRAATRFPFATFELDVPRVARVLSVDDDIRLEYDFRLVPER